jgi:hypothetical protein
MVRELGNKYLSTYLKVIAADFHGLGWGKD